MEDAKAYARALERNPHLREYIQEFVSRGNPKPEFHVSLSRDMRDMEEVNLIYPVGDPIFVHILRNPKEARYIAIEPVFTPSLREKYYQILDRMLEIVPYQLEPQGPREFKLMIDRMLEEICDLGDERPSLKERLLRGEELKKKVRVEPREFDELRYKIMKEMAGLGALEPFIRDPYIEDIHCIGIGNIYIFHKVFELLETNVGFFYDRDLDAYCYKLSEYLDKPVSKYNPIVDGALPDGSRINIIFGRDASKKGSSFTIRKFTAVPISITQLVAWGSLSAQMAAYLWLALENGMSVLICGETASGKTTLLNAIASFIKSSAKILSAEDTPEVNVPHENWQQLITRGSLGKAKRKTLSTVEMQDLLKAALRSRPDYIIVGEIRGAEGAIAFQAIQAGRPVMATFHASSVRKMIQRFTSDPINVPQVIMGNLNLAVFQQALYYHGKFIRRVLEIVEIEGYSPEVKGILTRAVFEWIPRTDKHVFSGYYNSYVLEEEVAKKLGYENTKEIYQELETRTRILEEMIRREIFDYFDVYSLIRKYTEEGIEALPFPVPAGGGRG
ncbi:MAG: type II/IV secretion system ATPase subunit [Euryarchaeota archaeon]|nr:type II/IV secretion system ATPase subunit [Euryarchaeota archaeon]